MHTFIIIITAFSTTKVEKLGACWRFAALYTFLPNSRTSLNFNGHLTTEIDLHSVQIHYIIFVLKTLGGSGAALFRNLRYLYHINLQSPARKNG